MKRRTFLTLLGAGAAAWPPALLAQQSKKALIGFVSWWPPAMASHLDALREGLREYGYVEGATVEFDAHFTAGDRDRTQEVVQRLVARNVDVLVASTTPAGQYPQFAEANGLLAFGFDDLALMRRAAYFVDRILKGAHPAALPVEQPTKYLLVINARTAERFGWSIPESLLIRADRVIE